MTKSLQRPRTRPVASGSASDKHQNTHTLQHTTEGRTESAVLSGAFPTLLLFEQFQTSLPHSELRTASSHHTNKASSPNFSVQYGFRRHFAHDDCRRTVYGV